MFRTKSQLFSSLLRPILWITFFGLSFNNFLGPMSSGGVGYLSFMTPGVVAFTLLFTSLFGGISILFDKNYGLMKEIIASPVSRMDIIIGKALSTLVNGLIQAAIIFFAAILLGARYSMPLTVPLSIFGVFTLLVLFSLGFIFLSSAIAIKLTSFEGLNAIVTLLTMPLFFASGALFPLSALPAPLQVISYINPLTYTVEGIKAFLLQPGGVYIPMMPAYTLIPLAYAVLLAFNAVMFLICIRAFKKTPVV